MKQKPNYSVLAAGMSALNGLVLLSIAIFYLVRPDILQGLVQLELVAGLALIGVLYYASLHRLIRRLHEAISTLALATITIFNLALVIAQTGGLDSPLYALWLLLIVSSGLFGTFFTIAILSVTVIAHLAAIASHGFSGAYVAKHIIQMLLSLVAAGLAELVYYRGSFSHQAVTSLSGKLSQEQLKAQVLMSSMADGVIVVDQSRHVQLINTAAQNMTGWDEASAQNIDYQMIIKLKDARGESITSANDPFSESWAKRASIVRSDLVCTTRNGKSLELSISVSPIYDNDNQQITGGIAVFRDVSHEKEISRTRNEFVSTASHEMRTPVAAIEGYISLAMNAKVATIDDRAMGYLEKAHENTQHLGALFRDLLSVTKLDEGLIARNLVPVNLTEMLKDITNDMQFAASKKNLTITFMPSAPYGPKMLVPSYWAMVDAERMREVIMNLIENGMKFTTEGGITISINGDDKNLTVALQDTGIGIPQEDISHLFQKFYRVDNSATRTIGGTGLGLYLCRTLVELFNGRIWLESQFGQGTTFYFSLPRINQPTTQAEATPIPNPNLKAPQASPQAPALVPLPAVPAPVQPAPILNSELLTVTPSQFPINPVKPSLTDIRPVVAPIPTATSAPVPTPQTVVAPQ